MVYSAEDRPFTPTSDEPGSDGIGVRVVLNRECGKGADFSRALELVYVQPGLIQAEGQGTVSLDVYVCVVIVIVVIIRGCSLDTVATQSVEGTAGRHFQRGGEQLQRPGLPRLRATGDKDGTRDQNGIEEAEGDLAVGGEVVDLGQSTLVVLPQVRDKRADGRYGIGAVLAIGACAELSFVLLELGQELQQQLRAELGYTR